MQWKCRNAFKLHWHTQAYSREGLPVCTKFHHRRQTQLWGLKSTWLLTGFIWWDNKKTQLSIWIKEYSLSLSLSLKRACNTEHFKSFISRTDDISIWNLPPKKKKKNQPLGNISGSRHLFKAPEQDQLFGLGGPNSHVK